MAGIKTMDCKICMGSFEPMDNNIRVCRFCLLEEKLGGRCAALELEVKQAKEAVEALQRENLEMREEREEQAKLLKSITSDGVEERKMQRDVEKEKMIKHKREEVRNKKPIDRKQKIVMIGDSMVETVGENLKSQHEKCEIQFQRGAKIEDVTEGLKKVDIGGKPIIIMIGGNNVEGDGTEVIMEKYKRMINTAEEEGAKKILVVGILERRHWNGYMSSKAYGINIRLEKECEERGVGFLGVDIRKEGWRWLAWDGIHPSRYGQDMLARKCYNKIRDDLNEGGLLM